MWSMNWIKQTKWSKYNFQLIILFMKEEEQKNIQQKQMLINRLYKTKNNQNTNKPLLKK